MATERTVKAICVWLDSDTDSDNPAWIVSRDTLSLPSGGADTTHTLSIHDDEADAMREGHKQAAVMGLPLYRNPANGPAVLIEEREGI